MNESSCDWCGEVYISGAESYASIAIPAGTPYEHEHTDLWLCLSCGQDLKRVMINKSFRDYINSCIGLSVVHGSRWEGENSGV